jgi:membrane protease YdiL (CAAX protease family)
MTIIPPCLYAVSTINTEIFINKAQPAYQFYKEQLPMESQVLHRAKYYLVIFIAAVLGLAILAFTIKPPASAPNAGIGIPKLSQFYWLLVPLGVVLMLRAVGGNDRVVSSLKSNVKSIGLWWPLSILIFPIVLTIFILICSWFSGIKFVGEMLPANLTAITTGLIVALVKIIFEEYAWRGCLAPKIYSLNLNIWLLHSIVGLGWGIWHLPFVFALWPYFTAEFVWYFAPFFMLGIISQRMVYNQIRLVSVSSPPYLDHARIRQRELSSSRRAISTWLWNSRILLSKNRDTVRHDPLVHRGFLAAPQKDEFVTSDRLNSSW